MSMRTGNEFNPEILRLRGLLDVYCNAIQRQANEVTKYLDKNRWCPSNNFGEMESWVTATATEFRGAANGMERLLRQLEEELKK